MTTVDLRGPCNRLTAKLDTHEGVIRAKCPRCSAAQGRPVYHVFAVTTGRLVETDEEARAEDPERAGRSVTMYD